MRKGWTETTLGELVKIQKGKKPPALDVREEASHPYLTADVLRGAKCEQFVSYALTGLCIQLSGRETVLLWDGAGAGDVFKSQPGILASTMAKLEARDSLAMDDGYLYLYLNFRQVTIKSSCRGTTVPHVSPEALKALYVSLPPLAEQKRIVDIVSSVDAYIDALQQQADTARTARNAVLHELLFAGGDDWTVTTLGDVAEWFSGGTPKAGKSEFYENGTIPWVVIADMMKTEIFDTASKITKAGLAEIGGRVAPKDSVLISMYATVGRPGFAHIPVATNQAIAWSIPNEKMIKPRFLLLVAQFLESEISSMARGATQRNINRAMLKEFSFSLPPLDEQKRIVEIVSLMDDAIQSTEQAVAEAKNLRSGLLSDLLSGGHEIPESYDQLLGAA
jgi:type I restriction enzyme, S subunit